MRVGSERVNSEGIRKCTVATFLLTTLFLFTPLLSAAAQTAINANKDQPLEISADKTLEWHRGDNRYIARGNVVAKQGDVTIKADQLTADYRTDQKKSTEIYRLTASGNVVISSQGNEAFGDEAVYDVDQGRAVMTGGNLRMIAPDQSVTARERFEYDVTSGRLAAIGGAKVVRGEDTLSADKVDAVFALDPKDGKRKLDHADAEGHVVITTPTDVLSGDRGTYKAASSLAIITGHVKITRGPNVLEGERAEVDLATNVSRMVGSPNAAATGSGRVRGVFYPGSGKAEVKTAPPPAAPQPAPAGRLMTEP